LRLTAEALLAATGLLAAVIAQEPRDDGCPFAAPALDAADPRQVAWAAWRAGNLPAVPSAAVPELRQALARLRLVHDEVADLALLQVLRALDQHGADLRAKELNFRADGLAYSFRLALLMRSSDPGCLDLLFAAFRELDPGGDRAWEAVGDHLVAHRHDPASKQILADFAPSFDVLVGQGVRLAWDLDGGTPMCSREGTDPPGRPPLPRCGWQRDARTGRFGLVAAPADPGPAAGKPTIYSQYVPAVSPKRAQMRWVWTLAGRERGSAALAWSVREPSTVGEVLDLLLQIESERAALNDELGAVIAVLRASGLIDAGVQWQVAAEQVRIHDRRSEPLRERCPLPASIAPRLAAESPAEVAWACERAIVQADGRDANVRALRAVLERCGKRTEEPERERVLLHAMHALIELGATVPADELALLAEGRLRLPRLVLLANGGQGAIPALLEEFHRLEPRSDPAWEYVGGLLLRRHRPLALELFAALQPCLRVSVGRSDERVLRHGRVDIRSLTGFPPAALYELERDDKGLLSVRTNRAELPPSLTTTAAPTPDMVRVRWLAELADLHGATVAPFRFEVQVKDRDLSRLPQIVAEAQARAQAILKEIEDGLVRQKLLPDRPAVHGKALSTEVIDHRSTEARSDQPLPVLPADVQIVSGGS